MIEGKTSVDMAVFRCSTTFLEVLLPTNHPELAKFLPEHGPGPHHVAFAMQDLHQRIEKLKEMGIYACETFVAGTEW